MTRIKNINTRIQLKNDTENNWNKAKAEEGKDGFIPLLGEAIVYMGENGHGPRIKIGDGETNVTELPFLEDNDTVYTASNGIEITAENIIQHINNLDAPPSEIGFYKIKYDRQGHINGATAVSKQDILNLLQMTPGRIDSVQITAEAPLVSSNSTENTTNLVTNISFSSQGKNTVLAGPTQSATGAPSFRLLIQDDIPNLSASKITEGQFSAERIDNLPTSKITSGVFDVNRIPNLGVNKITGIIPVSQGGTGVDGVNGNLENNIPSFFNNGVFAYDAVNARFKQFSITALGNTDTFSSYVDSLNGATENLLIDLDTLIRAIPPMNLVNPAIKYDENQEIKQSYRLSYYSPTTKGIKNSVLISDGDGDSNENGLEPIWLDPTNLSTEGHYGGALFYGRDNDSESLVKPFKTQWGTLPVEQGGTGNTSFSIGQVLIGSGKNSITTIEKTNLATSNTIVQRDINGDFAAHSITLVKSLLGESFNSNFPNRNIIDIDNNNIATFFGILNANNLKATIGEIEMNCSLSDDNTKQSKIKWYNSESTPQLIGELYWDNISKRGILKNYYLSENLVLQSDAYYLPEVNASSTTNNNFTFLATEDTVSNMFPINSVLYSNGKVNKITYKNSANGALYSTSVNGSLEWGTLPVEQGGTGVTTIADIQAGKDGDGNTITSKYITIDTDQLSITGKKRFTKAVQCHRYTTDFNLPAITMDKPGSHYIGIGADGIPNRIRFGPCRGLDGSAWIDTNTFNSNEWYFQGNITCTGNVTANIFFGTLTGDVIGNAATATKFASSQSITLTGDTTGTVSSQAGWSITTKTDRLSTVGDNRAVATTPNDYNNKIIFQGLKTNNSFDSPSTDDYSYIIGLRGWEDSTGGKAHEFAFNNSGINHRIGSTTSWENWEKIITSENYTDYTVTKTGSGASGTWEINITGHANSDLALTGGTLTGNLTTNSDIILTNGYLKGSANDSINHAIKLGHSDDNVMEFNEYGGLYNFYRNASNPRELIFQINGAQGTSAAPLPVTSGGTGATTPTGARTNLGITPANIGAVSKTGDTMTGVLTTPAIELGNQASGHGGYIDFHYNGSAADFTTRIIENSSGNLIISGSLTIEKNGLWVQGGSSAGSNNSRMGFVNGMPDAFPYNTSKRGVKIYSNAIALADPYNGNSNSDAGWIRHLEESANSGILEIGVGDDGNESIVARQYNTSSSIARTFTLLDASGNTSVPGNLTVNASNATGGGLILSDDGDIVDLNDAYCSMRFTSGVRIFSSNRGGSAVITLGSNGIITAGNNIYACSLWANQGSGERQVGVSYNGGNLYFWGNSSSGAAGIYDSNGGYVLQRNSSTNKYIGYFDSLQISGTITATNYIYSTSYLQAANTIYMNAGPLNIMYNNTWYPIIQNHGNGNTSFNAASGGIYYGYSNTSGHYFYLNSTTKIGQLDSNGLRIEKGKIEVSVNNHTVSIEANSTNCGIKVDGAWLCFRANGGNHFPNS